MQRTDFYVYEHIRADTKAVFYVGKGSGRRFKRTSPRPDIWHKTVKDSNGFISRFVAKNLDEELAYFVEEERINQLHRLGAKIINDSHGGAGAKGCVRSAETIKRMSESRKGKPKTERQLSILAEGRKMLLSLKATCPHCGKIGNKGPMIRWHFDNCKKKA